MSRDPRLRLLLPEDEIESGAWDQIQECLYRDDLVALAIMPDIHQGYSLPIGGVALLKGTVSPAYVGVDIGCGMIHVDTGFPLEHVFPKEQDLVRTFNNIVADIPIGPGCRSVPIPVEDFPDTLDKKVQKTILEKASVQLGTLGGGK